MNHVWSAKATVAVAVHLALMESDIVRLAVAMAINNKLKSQGTLVLR